MTRTIQTAGIFGLILLMALGLAACDESDNDGNDSTDDETLDDAENSDGNGEPMESGESGDDEFSPPGHDEEGELLPRTVEAIIVHHADRVNIDCLQSLSDEW